MHLLLLMCTHVPTSSTFPMYFHFYKCIFVPQCAALLQMYICAPMCPTSPMCSTFANVYLCPNVPHFYKCIFVPQCAPLLQMYICAPMCPTSPMCPTFTNVYLCGLLLGMSKHERLKTIHLFTWLYRCCRTSFLMSHICIHIRR